MSEFLDKDGNLVEFVLKSDKCLGCGRPNEVMLAHHHGFTGGVEAERERIIKLLEDKRPKSWHGMYDQGAMYAWQDIIALIKGETE